MNIVFMGSSGFGIPSLRRLAAAGFRISCVVTQPDKKQNRGMRIEPTAIKEEAGQLGLDLYQPHDVNSPGSIQYLAGLKPELFVVIAYGQKLSQAVLDIPSIMPVNIHASLLPAYRGAAPINWAIMRGERTTGVTLMKVTLAMDTGPVIMQKPIDILDSDTSLTLAARLSDEASSLLVQGIGQIATGSASLTPQDDSKASSAPKLKRTDGLIAWNRPASDVINLIRGCMPWPGAYTYYKGKTVKIHKASYARDPAVGGAAAGRIAALSRDGIVAGCGAGSICIEAVQMQGKRVITALEFVSGYKVNAGDVFG